MKIRFNIWNTIEISAVLVSLIAAFYVLVACNEPGFEWLWVLPLSFMFCTHGLILSLKKCHKTVFYFFFDAVAFVRYVLGPVLLVYTNEYYGRIVKSIPSNESVRIAVFLMGFELIVCTFYLWLKNRKRTVPEEVSENNNSINLPSRTWIYDILFIITIVLTALYPITLGYFSIATIGMSGLKLSSLSLFQQITIMLQLCSKYFVFVVVLAKMKKLYDKSNRKLLIEICAVLFTFLWSMIYAGHNRADFLFSVICQFYVFSMLFPKNRKNYFWLAISVIVIVLPFMTNNRNYTDYYTEVSGFKRFWLSLSGTIGAYFGGITNVAVSVDFKTNFAEYRTIEQFFKDILIPIVGVNKLIPFKDEMITNTLFNYQFFATVREPSQILPSIGQGYFYFGLFLAPIMDLFQLYIVTTFEKMKSKINSLELIYLFNIVEMRFALLFGQNITQQINCISMELMLPIIFYFINTHFVIKRIK